MACDEMLIHTDDVGRALEVPFAPPHDLAERVLQRLFPWVADEGDPWDLLRWASMVVAVPVIAYAGSNAIVVTDYADNLRRIEKIIAAIDVETRTGTEAVHSKNGLLTTIAWRIGDETNQVGRIIQARHHQPPCATPPARRTRHCNRRSPLRRLRCPRIR